MSRHDPSFFRTCIGLLALAPVVVLPPHAMALPTGPQVISGRVDYTHAGNQGLVTQHTRNAIVNWRSFDIGAAESLRISQSSSQAAMLARVTGGDPTKILGQLHADGRLFLINERGILVGAGARIDTAAFIASTLDVADADFLRGTQLTFKGDSSAGVVNLGTLVAREGDVLLFAHTVKNSGDINAPKGAVALAAGTEVLLASVNAPDFVIKANLPGSTEKTGVDNSGVIAAAQARLEAAGGSLYELAVNQSGVVRATGSTRLPDGRVLLTADGGTVGVSGKITARDAKGSGGEILVGGDYRGENASVANADRTVVTSTAVLDASSASSSDAAGRVIVWADDATRFLGTLKATGKGGGFAEVSGKNWLDFNPAKVVKLGKGGTLLLDPDALVISDDANANTSTSGADPFVFGLTSEPAVLNVDTLEAQLAATNVVLDTTSSLGDITFNAPVTWSTNNALTVRSGNSIYVNANITGGSASTLALYTGIKAMPPPESGQPYISGEITIHENATVSVGTLAVGVNSLATLPHGYTRNDYASATLFADGVLNVDTLKAELTSGPVSINAGNPNNAIGTFTTHGTGTLQPSYVVDGHGDLDVFIQSANSDAGYMQFFTVGDLTLKSGSSLNFVSPDYDPDRIGNIVFVSSSGAFINKAGADVFGDNTRFLIYTNTPASTKKDGLVGTNVYNHAYDPADDFDDEVSRFFFSAASGAPLLTYTANNLSRFYGASNPTLTFSRTGLLDGLADDVTGAPSLSTSATSSSGATTYTINIALGNLHSDNYDFAFVPGTLTVKPAPLTITANDFARRLNASDPDFDATFSGFVLGQNRSVLAGTLTFTTTSNSASPVGIYDITPSGLSSSNYDITFVPGKLTIANNVSLTISARNASRLYGASGPSFLADYSGFIGNDDESHVTGLQFSTSATKKSGVGTYTITPHGATAEGYAITFVPATLTITPAPLTIALPNQGRVYGDANDFTVNYSGFVNDDTSSVVAGLAFTTDAVRSSNVGNYLVTPTGATAANYNITFVPGTLSITPATLTVSINAASRHYGDADPAFTYSVSGLKNSDAAGGVVNVTGLASLASANSGIGAYGILGFTTLLSSNYTVAPQATGTLTITPRPLTITANRFTRVYGDANPALTATYDGLASFDNAVALFGDIGLATSATSSSGVGTFGITFNNVSNPNYTITRQFGSLTITPAPITFSALLEYSRIYGRANPSMTLPTVSGLKLTDTEENLGLAFSTPALNANVGDYTYRVTVNNPNYAAVADTGSFTVTPAPLRVTLGSAGRVYGDANPSRYDMRVTGLAFDHTASSVIGVSNPTDALTNVGTYDLSPVLNNTNYYIESFSGGDFVISPRPLILTAANRVRTYGAGNPAFTGYFTGFVNGDTEAQIVLNYGFTTEADRFSSVGTYTIRPTARINSVNYALTYVEGTLTITPAPLFISIADAVRAPGLPNPVFEVADSQGLKNKDTLPAIGLELSSPAAPTSQTGAYPITGSIASPNYDVTFQEGTLFVAIPQDVVDLTQQLDPSRLNTLNPNQPINRDIVIEQDQEVEVDKPETVTVAVNRDVAYDTKPLTPAQYAAYFGGYIDDTDSLRAAMQSTYANLLKGQGVKDSDYENMPPAARELLASWMNGTLSSSDLQALVASGDSSALLVFGLVLPRLVDLTRAKKVEDLTPIDRDVLGRLADLTEQRRSETVRIAQRKYEEMVKAAGERAESSGLAVLFFGPGDFKNIVDSATEEALGTYIGASVGAFVGTGATAAVLLSIPAVANAIFPLASSAGATASGSAAGPATAAALAVVLAIRAVQMGESIKNEAAFNELMASWKLGTQITSIEQLQSSSMDADMSLSTLMLATEMLKSAL